MTDRTPESQASIAELVAQRVRALRESEPPKGNLTRPLLHTVPMVLASTMTLALGADMLAPTQAKAAEPEQPVSAPPPVRLEPPQVTQSVQTEAATVVTAASVPSSVTVRSGDTVSGIAAKYGLSTSTVLKLNGLKATSLIYPGQVLQLKAASTSSSSSSSSKTTSSSSSSSSTTKVTYTVKSGDTVSGIAAKYKVSTQSVLDANKLKMNSIIYVGQKLTIPGVKTTSSGSSSTGSNSGGSSNTGSTGSSGGTSSTTTVTYTVKSGDTVSGIAAKYKVSTQSVLDANKLKMNSIIYVGQKLTIPGVKTTSSGGSSDSGSNSNSGSSGSNSGSSGSSSGSSGSNSGSSGSSGSSGGGSSTPAPTKCDSVKYTINSGDTVSKIAAKFGVTTQSVLNANGLTWTSIIYAGATLTIPNPTLLTDGCVVTASMTSEMKKNAQIIVDVGRAAGVSDYGLIIALATAAQESGLRNIAYGDRDSLGLFQQRPSAGWGTAAQIMDPVHAAKAFFGGAGNPNKGKTIGLLDIPGWQNMTVTQAAQAVQRSATPNAYAKWEASARDWLKQLR